MSDQAHWNWFPACRREARPVAVGRVVMGGGQPIVAQSMLTADTMDTAACVEEALALATAGCEVIRITAPTVKDARNLAEIRKALRARGCEVPLVADIHFKPEAALEAAHWVEKVRINPGNFADSKKFAVREYTTEQYAAELERIRQKFTPLVEFCKARGIAMRIGTNHGSLSDRIMNRYGDTPLGMVESALEYTRVARDLGYHHLVFSMKASNPKVMVAAYRLLAARLASLGPDWNYPLHLGVTEAGDGEDGRVKSAIGIGSLLADGLGDTIRVSLTEDSIHEIPVARALAELAPRLMWRQAPEPPAHSRLPDPFTYERRSSCRLVVGGISLGGGEVPRVFVTRAQREALPHDTSPLGDTQPEGIFEDLDLLALDPRDTAAIAALENAPARLVTVADHLPLPTIGAFRLLAARLPPRHPILLKDTLDPSSSPGAAPRPLLLAAATLGSLLCDGIGDAILVRSEPNPQAALRLAYNILQAAGARIFKTDYVACPSCGRTLFNLQETTARIRAATAHLKGVRIAVMGCIVNGPGEMADADFGYVGGAPGKVNLYVGKTAVKFNIPEAEAVSRLVDLIKEHNRWT
ncbi:MAG: (E)-4-hydroxy-3-methylbut-2-enyl-diphosphate synthase, partial [Terrimicrobiaceae bacterium]|nr:(E)-4-hydroxy-3-methylbut-2-enyl-diphosphate synthase [Terrimicrobiaceae bacterium]